MNARSVVDPRLDEVESLTAILDRCPIGVTIMDHARAVRYGKRSLPARPVWLSLDRSLVDGTDHQAVRSASAPEARIARPECNLNAPDGRSVWVPMTAGPTRFAGRAAMPVSVDDVTKRRLGHRRPARKGGTPQPRRRRQSLHHLGRRLHAANRLVIEGIQADVPGPHL